MLEQCERRKYILVEHLVATLIGCVITYSELEAIVDNLGIGSSVMRVYDRTRWALKENEIRDILQQLQNHKSSLGLMLTILQCTTNNEIQQSVVRLCNLMEQAVASNDNLSVRLSRLEGNISLLTRESSDLTIYDERDDNSVGATIRPINSTSNNSSGIAYESPIITFAFDSELMSSRAYSKAKFITSDGHSESSLTSSARRTAAFSTFSTQSLAEISNSSVYSLSICFGDIGNGNWYILASAGPARAMEGEYEIHIRSPTGKIGYYRTTPSTTCLDLKKKIFGREGLPPSKCVLIFAGKRVSDITILRQIGLGRGCNGAYILFPFSAGDIYGG